MCQQVRIGLWKLSHIIFLTVPAGVAHEMEEDEIYKWYFLPKGTRILPLDW
jgi:hypothetical protein